MWKQEKDKWECPQINIAIISIKGWKIKLRISLWLSKDKW